MNDTLIIEQSFQSALSEYRSGRLAQAEELCRTILVLEPDHADALHLLGLVCLGNRRLDEALELIAHAIELNAGESQYHASHGLVLAELGQFTPAIEAYLLAVQIEPDFAEAFYNLGIAYRCDGQVDRAIQAYQKALELKPAFPEAMNNYAHALRQVGRLEEAVEVCRQVLEVSPEHVEARNNLGVTLKDLGQVDDAIACLEHAMTLHPDQRVLESNYLYSLYYQANADAADIGHKHRLWNDKVVKRLSAASRRHENDPSPGRRLKVGYVSPDFREHCQAMFMLPLLANHDHESFAIHCYSNRPESDSVTERIKAYADSWSEIAGRSDDDVADQIRADGIDILVDLTLHMGRNRLMVFARRPAPVQVSWLGYPGTTGLSAIDYRLTDPYLDPPGQHDEVYAEASLRLPETFWCYDSRSKLPVNELPAVSDGHITFGCLNNFCKVNDRTLALWRRVLEAVPCSRLHLLAPPGQARSRILRQLAVSPDRITFLDFQPREAYLELYHAIDICLDTFPYNGHTTSLDSLWMGVPVVSLCGDIAVSRAGLSQLSNLGLPELVAHDEAAFVKIATDLANDPSRLALLRKTLRGRMEASPLMNAPRFTRNIEAAYRSIWQKWCRNRSSNCATMERVVTA